MKEEISHLEQLAQIRTMMERSSRFISLSGLSGIFAGTVALIGAGIAFWYVDYTVDFAAYSYRIFDQGELRREFLTFLLALGAGIFTVAFAGAYFFTVQKAKKDGVQIWNSTSKRLLVNIAVPLIAGACFVLSLLHSGAIYLIAPSTLIFYGMALMNGSKYTLDDIRYLGLSEIALGIIALWFVGYGLVFWAIGFGVLHIIYGVIMYTKYDKK